MRFYQQKRQNSLDTILDALGRHWYNAEYASNSLFCRRRKIHDQEDLMIARY